MRSPDSADEYDLEQRSFHAANHNNIPDWVKCLIADLWGEVISRDPSNFTKKEGHGDA